MVALIATAHSEVGRIAESHAALRTNEVDFAEAVLRDAVLSGLHPAGSAIDPERSAAEIDVPVQAVRRALRHLEQQKIVEFAPFRGAVVVPIRLIDAIDNFAIREALEPMAFALSIPHLQPDDFVRARLLIDEMTSERLPRRMGQLNREFHQVLYSRAGRPKLLQLINEQLNGFDLFVRFNLAFMGRDTMPQAEHLALVELAESGDIPAASELARRHAVNARYTVEQFFAAHPLLDTTAGSVLTG